MMKIDQKIVITGIIMPHKWDENGRIIGIALYTNSEEIYALEHNRLTQGLMNLMHKRVEIRGKMREHGDGNVSIAARNYILRKEIFDDAKKTN